MYTRSFDHPLIEARVLISLLEPMSFERIPPPGARIYEQLSLSLSSLEEKRNSRASFESSANPEIDEAGGDGVFSAQ